MDTARRTQSTARTAPRFVASRLGTLPPGTYTDPAQPGLQLRVRPRGTTHTRAWLLRIVFGGAETRLALGTFPELSLAEAREAARTLRAQARQGIDPRSARRKPGRTLPAVPSYVAVAVKAGPHSIETLCDEFMERFIRPRRKRPEYALDMLRRDILPVWRGRDARTIRPREVIELLDGIVERGSRVQANRVAGILGQLFRFGIHRAIVETSPVQLLYRPGGKEKPRDRVLSDDELRVILSDPQDATRFERMSHVIVILLLTGQRRGELAQARWDHVDLAAGTWRIPAEHSKNGRGHVCPLTAWAVREFEALHRVRDSSAFVLPGSDATMALDPKLLTRSLARCQSRLAKRGVAPFTLHDLRRTCRTGLAKLGVPPHIGKRVLNHAQERIPGTYDVHDYMDEKRLALGKWAARLSSLIGVPA